MTNPERFHADLLLHQLQQVKRFQPDDIKTLCAIGYEFAQRGLTQETSKCYRVAVDALLRVIQAGNVELALRGEESIYRVFVTSVEEEQHYYRCFSDWKNQLAALGRRFRDPAAMPKGGADRVAFFLHSGHILGHTEVLLKMLESRPRSGQHRVEPRVYVLDRCSPDFLMRCRSAGVEVVAAIDALGPAAPLEGRFLWLRKRFQEDRIGVLVWVSYPPMAAFALSMRLAPVQIFWALRFHPISAPYIDGYISWGAPGERTRRYGRQDWEVVPMPLALEDTPVPRTEIERLRGRFPEPVLLGTLAREQKIYSMPYLRAVASILAANPQAAFLWTGRSEHPGIAGFLRAAGVAERCHFVGWVDTKVYAAALDVFLETFPFGSGVTALQALGAGTPLLSYLHPETIFGTYWPAAAGAEGTSLERSQHPLLDAPDRHEILCARDADEYVSLANRLVADPSWRKEVGGRGRAFFLDEYRRTASYAERFFETIGRIASAKLGRPTG